MRNDARNAVGLKEFFEVKLALTQANNDLRHQCAAELEAEREKARVVKEITDQRAITLARRIQTYRDEHANGLQRQIQEERGEFVTRNEHNLLISKIDEAIKAITLQQGSTLGSRAVIAYFVAAGTTLIAAVEFLIKVQR